MKRTIIFAVLIFALCGISSAQTSREALDKVRQIRPLESSREDVQEILSGFELDDADDEEHYQEFSNDAANIEVWYASGKCGEDAASEEDENDETEIWNVGEWKVTRVEVRLDEPLKTGDAGFDLSELKKEKNEAYNDVYAYYGKSSGVVLIEDEGEIGKIYLLAPQSGYSMLCDNRRAKEFSAVESWFGSSLGKVREIAEFAPNLTALTLSATEIIIGCDDAGENKSCADDAREIEVNAIGSDPENDVLTYNYVVSAGRIVGTGSRVVWDLTGVGPGTYTVNAGVDDGCGVCGTTRTEKVVIKKCPSCRKPLKPIIFRQNRTSNGWRDLFVPLD